jgi:hypothetical protein
MVDGSLLGSTMTAIYAYCLPERHRAALISDDRETNTGARIDKVWLSCRRYGVAAYGSELTLQAIGILGQFEGREGFPPANSATEFAERVAETMKSLVETVYPSLVQERNLGRIPAAKWQAMHENPARFLVLDTTTFELLDVDLGIVLPHERILPRPDVRHLPPRKLHLRALARQAAGIEVEELVDEAVDSSAFFSNRLARDSMRTRGIGSLGAVLWCSNGEVTLTSAFASVPEYFAQMKQRTIDVAGVVSSASS